MYAVAGAAIMQGVGALMKGQSESDAINTQATIQRKNAAEAIQASRADADRQTILSGAQIGKEAASFGASGVDVNTSGSVLNVLGASAANAELDRQNILHGGTIRSINYLNQASLDQTAAGNALKAGQFGAIGAGVGAAFKIGSYSSGGGTDLLSRGGSNFYGGPDTFGATSASRTLGVQSLDDF